MKYKQFLVHCSSYIVLCSLFILLMSCELETSDNGNLDGMWQLYAADTLRTPDGTPGGSADMRQSGKVWAFQGRIMMLRQSDGFHHMEVICKFEHEGQWLRVYDPHFSNREIDDPRIDDPETLFPYGLHALDNRLQVQTLSKNWLEVQTDELRLKFRKY